VNPLEGDTTTLRMRTVYAVALCMDECATIDDLREAVTMLEETERTARRVLGSAHPVAATIENTLRRSRASLRARSSLWFETSEQRSSFEVCGPSGLMVFAFAVAVVAWVWRTHVTHD